jgi:hypothetical protein
MPPVRKYSSIVSIARFQGRARLNSGRFTVWKFPTFFGSLRDREWQWLPSTADDESLSDLLQTY